LGSTCGAHRIGRGYGEGGGRWYYEVTLRTGGIMQIGWATKDSVFKPEVPDSSRLIERLEKEGILC